MRTLERTPTYEHLKRFIELRPDIQNYLKENCFDPQHVIETYAIGGRSTSNFEKSRILSRHYNNLSEICGCNAPLKENLPDLKMFDKAVFYLKGVIWFQ